MLKIARVAPRLSGLAMLALMGLIFIRAELFPFCIRAISICFALSLAAINARTLLSGELHLDGGGGWSAIRRDDAPRRFRILSLALLITSLAASAWFIHLAFQL